MIQTILLIKTRTLRETDGFAKYKIQNSSNNQEFEMEIGSPFKGRSWEVEIMIMPPAMHAGGSGSQGREALKGEELLQLYGPTMLPAVLHVSMKQKHMEVFKRTHLHLV